jgi:hypothetical protein
MISWLMENNLPRIQCFWCEAWVLKKYVTRDHIWPRRHRKGRKDGSKTVPACSSCNQQRGLLATIERVAVGMSVKKNGLTEKLVKRHCDRMRQARALLDKWIAKEQEKLGFSPSRELKLDPL